MPMFSSFFSISSVDSLSIPSYGKKVVPSVQKGCICVKIARYNFSVARSERNLEQSLL